MKKMIVAILSIFLWANTSTAKPLYIGFVERPPHIYANADGSIRGLLGKQLQDIFKRARVESELVRTFPKDIDKLIGRVDLNGFIATKTLMDDPDNYLFTDEPLFILDFYVYHLATTPSIAGLSELKNTSVILPIPLNSFEGPLKEHLIDQTNKVTVHSDQSNLEQQIILLRKNRAKYAISYFGPNNIALMFSKRANRDDIQSSQLFELPMYFVLKKSVDDAPNIMHRVNLAYAESR
ncbi:hypothetical protein [Aliiglaciecola sp. M165]|uniref:hypothetical protein n=1 Tax=Aliiglaciecola sp. M165 TaxID=2593649 RepID=UPI0011817225|nr:hypothetical protein [Aliiglaciecola sp. M165]TRY29879.1 hypothetical protein FM019_17070 [Aliiglaciecola sp. M165]